MVSGLTFPRPVGGAELKRASQTRLCHSPELLRAAPAPAHSSSHSRQAGMLPPPTSAGSLGPYGSEAGGQVAARTVPAGASHARAGEKITIGGGARPQGAVTVLLLCPSARAASQPVGSLGLAPTPKVRRHGHREAVGERQGGQPGPGPRAPPGCRAPGSLLASPGNEPGKAGRGAQTRPAQNIHQEILPTAAPLPPRGRPWGSTLKIDRKSKNR